MWCRFVLALAFVLACSSLAMAGESENSAAGVGEADVQAKKNVPPIRTEIEVNADAPLVEVNFLGEDLVETTRVSRFQMEDLQAVDLLTGLRMTPGVLVSRYNPVGSYGGGDGGTIFIRGMGSGRPGGEVQFLVDGVPKFSGVWTHPLMDVLSIDSLDHVDVVKGASPVLYGNMAFGVVDIRSRRMERDGWEAAASVSGGSFRTLLTHLDGGYREGRFDANFAGGYRMSDGARPQSGGKLADFFGRVGYALSPGWRLDATVSHTDNYTLDPGPDTAPPPPAGRFAIRDFTTVITLENSTDTLSGYFRWYRDAGAIRWETWNAARSLVDHSDTDYANWGFRARQTAVLPRRFEVTAGFDFDDYGGSFRNTLGSAVKEKGEVRLWNAAPYVLAGVTWGDRVRVNPVAGVRYNASRYFGDFLAPQAGLEVVCGGTRLHASAGRGFNLPGVYAVFSYQDWNQGDKWKDLKPEKIVHLEGGVSQEFGRKARLDFTLFRDHGKDALRFTAPPPHYDNIGDYRTWGVETALGFEPRENIHAFAAYTWLDAQPANLPYAPEHTAQLGVNWDVAKRWRVSADAQYVGERWSGNPRYPGGKRVLLEGFFLLNARMQVRISPDKWKEKLVLFAGIENLTGTEYEYQPGYDMPGINFLGGVRMTLGGE